MRIVFDGGPLTVETGGIRRYVEELAVAFAEAFPADELCVAAERAVLGRARLERSGVRIHDSEPGGWRRKWWLAGLPALCRRLNATVFHGTDFSVPYIHRLPAVLTIHDLSPWLHREWQPAASRIRRRTPWLLRLQLADAIITVSEAIRREAIARFSLDASRVFAVPLAADSRFRPTPASHAGPPYVLYVGTLEPRKNVPTLVAAWEALHRQTGVVLRIAGRKRSDFRFDLDRPGIDWMGAVPDEALPQLYSNALAVVYPSAYEGFGLPALEAMQCGAPVVVGDTPALRELVGDAGEVVNGDDGDALGNALSLLVNSPGRRADATARSLQRAARYSWRATAQQTREVYAEAVARFGR